MPRRRALHKLTRLGFQLSTLLLRRQAGNATDAAFLVHQDHRVPLVSLESPENQVPLVRLASQESLQSRHVMCHLHHRASHVQRVHPDRQDLPEMLVMRDHLERQEDRVLMLQLESQDRRVHRVHQDNQDATVHQANPDSRRQTSLWNPEMQDHREMLDPQAHQDHLDHRVKTVCQAHKDQRDQRVRQASRAKTDYLDSQVHQANLVLRERRAFAPSTAHSTVESFSKTEREDRRGISSSAPHQPCQTTSPQTLFADAKNFPFPQSALLRLVLPFLLIEKLGYCFILIHVYSRGFLCTQSE